MKQIRLLARDNEKRGWSRWLNRRPRRLLPFLCGCVLALITPRPAAATQDGGVEYQAKLAFIYNLARFVEWPSNSYAAPDAPLRIGIVGADPFSPALETDLRARTVKGHPVEIRMLGPGDTMGGCQIVFIPLAAKGQSAGIVKGLQGSSTLTIGETEGFATRGGIINIVVRENRLHFEVNRRAAEQAGLTISSKLLDIATIIEDR